ncbi:pirin family protein [Terriglobus sp. 2YAB30_2]|uniref:pirin family protein n=1 Tax=unclassified Terriglobus TaxID=2628988 RepID=UPI003F99472A
MITVRKSKERGHANHGWLDSYHTFSFANYYDAHHMGFGPLRVINEDVVAPGRGFGSHPHRDMEILTYVISGKLAHKDSMGHTEELGPNEIQRMSAGSGVVHSEFNGSNAEPVHLFQVWIEPRTRGEKPSYEQLAFDPAEKKNRFRVLASSTPVAGAATINQDAAVAVAELEPGKELDYELAEGRSAWVHVVKGDVQVNGTSLQAGDAAALRQESKIHLQSGSTGNSEVLVFELVA